MNIMLESNPLKSSILVQRLAVSFMVFNFIGTGQTGTWPNGCLVFLLPAVLGTV